MIYATEISLLIGCISLDNTAFIQMMISQPLAACSLIGLAGGHPDAGINMGIAFQLLFAADLPTGSHLPKDASLMSMCALGASLIYAKTGGVPDTGILGAAAVLAVLAEPLFTATGGMVRRLNGALTPVVRSRLEQGSYRISIITAQGGLVFFFLRALVVSLIFSTAGAWLLWGIVRYVPGEALMASGISFVLFPLIGAAHLLVKIKRDLVKGKGPSSIITGILHPGKGHS